MKQNRWSAGLWFIVVSSMTLSCWNPFAPKLTTTLDTEDYVVTQQETPSEVLQNFKIAYAFKDSLLYSDVIDSAFLFVYYDPDEGASGQFISWDRDVDLKTTGKMFRHFQIVDLVWNATLYEREDEESAELNKGFTLSLVSDESDFHVTGKALFSFRKCQDTKWRITRWKDESDL
jgi:hypothetical protein